MKRSCLAAALGAAVALAAPGTAGAGSLPAVVSGERPGPELLYAPAPRAPQLENAGVWRARPILVSGATAYRNGEFLYQDFLNDDHGAVGTRDPATLGSLATLEPSAGTLTYPTDPVFAGNAADLVELRVRPLAAATTFRVTLNTLIDPERTAFTVAIGSSEQARTWPHASGVRSPAQAFLTVHGSRGELVDAATRAAITPPPKVAVDRKRRQITVRVPHATWHPGRSVVRLAAGVGLWDTEKDAYLAPGGQATATTPGGGAKSDAALFNVAFRMKEPQPVGRASGQGLVDITVAPAAGWRESAQAAALADGDISRFFAEVDFGKLRERVRDDSAVPRTGPVNRILSSREEYGQGVDAERLCGRFPVECHGYFGSRLQPYTVYVPDKPRPRSGYGLTLLLHALLENHNEYVGSRYQTQLGDRGTGYLVVTPSARGPDGDYTDAAEANAFETWADLARHYRLAPSRTTISGYSMGGGGTYRLLTRWPDLFARGAAVGAAALEEQTGFTAAMRNTPILTWVGAFDEGTTPNLQEQAVDNQTRLGLDFRFATFPTADHFTIPQNDEFGPFADFLGDHTVDRSPPHLTLGVVGRNDYPAAGVVADHAYWVSGLRVRGPRRTTIGSIDARSEGFGVADPVSDPLETVSGVVAGGNVGPLAFVERRKTRSAPATVAVRDRLTVRTKSLASATIDTRRARVSCAPRIALTADGPLALRLDCPPATKRARCGRPVRVRLPAVLGRRITRVSASRRGRVLLRARGRRLRRVAVRRPTRRAFTLTVRARTAGGAASVSQQRRFPACAQRG